MSKKATAPSTTKKRPKPMNLEGVEVVSDARPKFEKLVKAAAKMGPKQHKTDK